MRGHGGAKSLDAALGVGLHTVGFAPGGSGEDDVCHLRGFGKEDVDNDEVVESLEGFFAMILVGVGDQGVLAIDDHGVDAVFFLPAHIESGDFGHRVTKVEIGLLVGFFELFLEFGICDWLEAGVVGGDRSAVAGSLDIVLPPHRVDAGAFLAEVAGEEGEVAEGLDVVDATDVLGNAQSVVDGAELGFSVPEGGLFDVGGGDFADPGSPIGSEFLKVGFEGFVFSAAIGDEFLVGKSFAHDDVSHGEEEGDVGPNADGEMKVGKLGKTGLAGVGDDESGSFGERFLEARRGDGVALGHIGADGKDGIGLVHVLERVGHCASSDLGRQTGDGGSVSGSTTVVYVMRAKARPDKLLHGIGGFVRSATTGDSVNTMAAVLCPGVGEAFGGGFKGFIPLDFFKRAVGLFDEWFFEAILMLDEVVGELAFDAKRAFVGGALHGGLGSDNFIALGHEVDRATDGAIWADRAGLFDLFGKFFGAEGLFVGEGSGGAGLDALAAEGAIGVAEVVVEFGGDLSVESPVGDGNGVVAFLLGADANASVAGDALFVVAEDEGVGVLEICGAGFGSGEAAAASAVFVDEGGEFL